MPVSELEVVRVSTAEFEGCLFCVHLIPYHVKTHPFLAHLAQLAQQWQCSDLGSLTHRTIRVSVLNESHSLWHSTQQH